MELANSRFGTELNNNNSNAVGRLTASSTLKPVSSVSTMPKATPVPTGGSKTTPTTPTTTTTTTTTTPPPVERVVDIPTQTGGGAGGGGGASEEKAPETKETVTEVSFFKKPVGQVTALIIIAALLYGGYRVMKSK